MLRYTKFSANNALGFSLLLIKKKFSSCQSVLFLDLDDMDSTDEMETNNYLQLGAFLCLNCL